MKEEPTYIDDGVLITKVEVNPFLYDTKSPDYRNLQLRIGVWSAIAKDLKINDRKLVALRIRSFPQ